MRRRGILLLEMLVAMVLFAIVCNLIAFAYFRVQKTHRGVTMALGDLAVAERLLGDVKRDLARARQVQVEPGRLTILLEGGREIRYEVAPALGRVDRSGEGPPGEYCDAFESLRFRSEGRNLVAIEVELRKLDPEVPYHARWRSMAGCPNVREDR